MLKSRIFFHQNDFSCEFLRIPLQNIDFFYLYLYLSPNGYIFFKDFIFQNHKYHDTNMSFWFKKY